MVGKIEFTLVSIVHSQQSTHAHYSIAHVQ